MVEFPTKGGRVARGGDIIPPRPGSEQKGARALSDIPLGDGWWIASDGKWYAPELHPDRQRPAVEEEPPPGWWLASDGLWYPPEDHPGLAEGRQETLAKAAGREEAAQPAGPRPAPLAISQDELDELLAAEEGGGVGRSAPEPAPGAWRGTVGAPPPGFRPPPGASWNDKERDEFFASASRAPGRSGRKKTADEPPAAPAPSAPRPPAATGQKGGLLSRMRRKGAAS